MRVVCLIQARRNSYRLQNKVLAKIGSKTMLSRVIERCEAIAPRSPVYAITPPGDKDLAPNTIAPDCPEADVLQRHVLAARELKADAVMRVTSDCPFVDPEIAREVLDIFLSCKLDYACNDFEPTYPKGLGVEVMTMEALEYAHTRVPPDAEYDRQHCSPFIIRHVRGWATSKGNVDRTHKVFDGRCLRCPVVGISGINLSVDEQYDLDLARAIYATGIIPDDVIRPMVHTLVAYRFVMDHWHDGTQINIPQP